MRKNKHTSPQPPRKGPMALVLAAVVAIAAAAMGINPDQLRSVDGIADAVGQVSEQIADAQEQTPPAATGQDNRQWAPFLPPEARKTVRLIQQGGPYPYRQDGTTFQNRERRLPSRERGWYREYTVDTPGLSHRGPRRIVTGGHPPTEWHYTDDHYDNFRSFTPPARTH